MPIYEYKCGKCGLGFEKLVASFNENPKCPECGNVKPEKLLSVFSAPTGISAASTNCEFRNQCPSSGSKCCSSGSCGHR